MNMKAEELFAAKLQNLMKLASEQGNCVSREQACSCMEECDLNEEQMELVFSYLTAHKVGIGEPVNLDDYLSNEEIDYLTQYETELQELRTYSEGEKEGITLSAMAGDKDAQAQLIEIYLRDVIQIAKLYTGQGVFLEDLIGEGNVALAMGVSMLGALENASEAQGMLTKMIMDAMEELITEDFEEQKKDEKLAAKVNEVADAARELATALGRKVTTTELAQESGLSERRIREAVKFSAGKIEDIDDQADQI